MQQPTDWRNKLEKVYDVSTKKGPQVFRAKHTQVDSKASLLKPKDDKNHHTSIIGRKSSKMLTISPEDPVQKPNKKKSQREKSLTYRPNLDLELDCTEVS